MQTEAPPSKYDKKVYDREYHRKNFDQIKAYHKQYRADNREIIAARRRHKYATDPVHRLKENIRSRITDAMTRARSYKCNKSIELLGCSVDFLKGYLESMFLEGMTWENRGNKSNQWNIDHIRPCASFDLTDPEQQKKCFHYTNLQPLWSTDNFRKQAKWNED